MKNPRATRRTCVVIVASVATTMSCGSKLSPAQVVARQDGSPADTRSAGKAAPPSKSLPQEVDKAPKAEKQIGDDKRKPNVNVVQSIDLNVRGILDCPTAPYPSQNVTAQSTASFSKNFVTYCVSCHGAGGAGQGAYPDLTKSETFGSFSSVVRSGRHEMPGFSEQEISDAELRSDFAALKKGVPSGSTSHVSLSWTTDEIDAKLASGLVAWRKPGKKGEACANCHGVDATDLAIIAYDDAAILRRSTLHVSPPEANTLVDYVHALRRKNGIAAPCSTAWRPFQPGGMPLPGATPKEQDEALIPELLKHGLLFATVALQTQAEKEASWEQLKSLNMRKIRIGIPLARWTEDSFNGPAHATLNDWISSTPRIPIGAEYYRLSDEYLADPTTSKMMKLVRSIETDTSDAGYFEASQSHNLSNLFKSKYQAVQIANHYFRMALQRKPGWLEESENPPLTVPEKDRLGAGSIFRLMGAGFQEDFCYGSEACRQREYDSLPALAKLDVRPFETTKDFKTQLQNDLTHPWWTIGSLFDASFKGTSSTFHYWFGFGNFPHDRFHKMYMTGTGLVKRIEFMDSIRKSGESPAILTYGLWNSVEVFNFVRGTDQEGMYKANFYKTFLHRMQAEQASGGKPDSPEFAKLIAAWEDEFNQWAKTAESSPIVAGGVTFTNAYFLDGAKMARELRAKL